MGGIGEERQRIDADPERSAQIAAHLAADHQAVRDFDAPTERARLRAELVAFEARHGMPSERLAQAFTDPDGTLAESADFHAWDETWASYRILMESWADEHLRAERDELAVWARVGALGVVSGELNLADADVAAARDILRRLRSPEDG
jgi:hypothetical protein